MSKYSDVLWNVARHAAVAGDDGPERVYFYYERQDAEHEIPVKVIIHPNTDYQTARRVVAALNLVLGYSTEELEDMRTLPPLLQPEPARPTITLPALKQLKVRPRRCP